MGVPAAEPIEHERHAAVGKQVITATTIITSAPDNVPAQACQSVLARTQSPSSSRAQAHRAVGRITEKVERIRRMENKLGLPHELAAA